MIIKKIFNIVFTQRIGTKVSVGIYATLFLIFTYVWLESIPGVESLKFDELKKIRQNENISESSNNKKADFASMTLALTNNNFLWVGMLMSESLISPTYVLFYDSVNQKERCYLSSGIHGRSEFLIKLALFQAKEYYNENGESLSDSFYQKLDEGFVPYKNKANLARNINKTDLLIIINILYLTMIFVGITLEYIALQYIKLQILSTIKAILAIILFLLYSLLIFNNFLLLYLIGALFVYISSKVYIYFLKKNKNESDKENYLTLVFSLPYRYKWNINSIENIILVLWSILLVNYYTQYTWIG